MSFNLATILHETALATPGAPAEIVGGRATAYGDLDEQSGRFAAGLRENGVEPGHVVALQLPNMPQFLAVGHVACYLKDDYWILFWTTRPMALPSSTHLPSPYRWETWPTALPSTRTS